MHQRLVRGRKPQKSGLLIGDVVRRTQYGAVVRLRGPIKRGDGVGPGGICFSFFPLLNSPNSACYVQIMPNYARLCRLNYLLWQK